MTSTLERKMMTTHADEFLNEVQKICATIDVQAIEKLADALAALRTGGGDRSARRRRERRQLQPCS